MSSVVDTAQELERMFEEGKLGEFLASEFHGERGRVDVVKDGEFMIGFKSAAATPNIGSILSKVTDFYQKHGFQVEVVEAFLNSTSFVVVIHNNRGTPSWEAFSVTVTTRYPISIGGSKDYLRVTSTQI